MTARPAFAALDNAASLDIAFSGKGDRQPAPFPAAIAPAARVPAATPASSPLAALIGPAPQRNAIDPALDGGLRSLTERLDLAVKDRMSAAVAVHLLRVAPVRATLALAELNAPYVIGRAVDRPGSTLVLMAGPDLIDLTVAAVFGGADASGMAQMPDRPATQLERALVERLFRTVMDTIVASDPGTLRPLQAASLALAVVDTESRRVFMPAPTQGAIEAVFALALGALRARLTLLILTGDGARPTGDTPQMAGTMTASAVADRIAGAAVMATAVIGHAHFPLSALSALQIGDTLLAGGREDDPFALSTGGLTLAQVRIGRQPGPVSVDIVTCAEPGRRAPDHPIRGIRIPAMSIPAMPPSPERVP